MTEFLWTVPVDHPAFAGHFPGRPIVPGVVLLDWLLLHLAAPLPGSVRYPGLKIGTAKFFSPAEPGETLRFTALGKANGDVGFHIVSAASPFRDIASGTLQCAP